MLPAVPRSASFVQQIFIRTPSTVAVVFAFEDVPDVPNRVTPRFLRHDGELLLEGTPVEAPDVKQVYVLGHGQVVSSGVVGKITGMLEGVGEGQDQTVDLDITLDDPWLKLGVTGHYPFVPPLFVLEMMHDGAQPVTYGATITVGDLGGG